MTDIDSKKGLLGRLGDRLKSTRSTLGLESLLGGRSRLTEQDIEDLETALLTADVGLPVTQQLIDRISRAGSDAAIDAVRQAMLELLAGCTQPLAIDATRKPFVILMVGVNGVGKTTTTAKLVQRFQKQELKVMIAAADTFRAAAVEQLQSWGQKLGVPVVAQHTGADAAAVAHDALESARARGIDVLIIDTAGRQATHEGLMGELAKIRRVITRQDDTAPHEVLQVLDGGTGQNALSQLRQFSNVVDVTGLVITKLDGTGKGGIVLALCQEFAIPVRYIGVGEQADDLQDFSAEAFVDAILPTDREA